jgi:uncharacterized protein (TIRG00374 family)
MHKLRPSRSLVFGAIVVVGMLALVVHSRAAIAESMALVAGANPLWLTLGVLAIVAGFVCAGQIYGCVLGVLGYRAPQPWLVAASTVSILISQSIPAGTLGSYAFLTASLRRRGVPGTSVALLASLELCAWIGGMLVLFLFGLAYKMLMIHDGPGAQLAFPAAATALTVVGGFSFAATRPRDTLHRWVALVYQAAGMLLRRTWPDEHVCQVVDELDANRRLVTERPGQLAALLCLQLTVFALHGLALLLLLHGLGVGVSPLVVLSSYGLALIVSTFTALPGGGGTVEAALSLALAAEGVPLEAAIGAAVLFRLFSYWLLLPVGAVLYRLLTSGGRQVR